MVARMGLRALALIAGGAMVFAPAAARQDAGGRACFAARDSAAAPFEVFQLAPPPRGARAAYAFHPLTAAATMQLSSLATAPKSVATWYFLWTNRSNRELIGANGKVLPRKPNLQPSSTTIRHQRTPFSSLDRADACTLAQAASLLGEAGRARTFAEAAGITLVDELQQSDEGDVGPQDTCVLAHGTLPAATAGIVLDYEAQDGRDEAHTLAFLTQFTRLVHGAGRQAILLIDPLDAPSQRYGGITPGNAYAITTLFDRTTVFLWGRNRQHSIPESYRAQMALLRQGGAVEGKRLLIDFDLAGSTLDDARFVHDAIVRDRLAGVMFWRNRAVQGGDCSSEVNQKIGTVVFGAAPTGRH